MTLPRKTHPAVVFGIDDAWELELQGRIGSLRVILKQRRRRRTIVERVPEGCPAAAVVVAVLERIGVSLEPDELDRLNFAVSAWNGGPFSIRKAA